MPDRPLATGDDPCVLDDVQPLLAELHTPIRLQCIDHAHPHRGRVERFIRRVFRHTHGADVHHFHPALLSFHDDRRLRAAVGYRDGRKQPLFAEHYLDEPATDAIARRLQCDVRREQLVEVGNLALTDPGDARWLIAATTLYLHRLGYRWVLFTATRPLFNAFRRLGLNPLEITIADPARLPDGGRDWGSYYGARPTVCAGSIASGVHKLLGHGRHPQSVLQALLDDAVHAADETLASPSRCGGL